MKFLSTRSFLLLFAFVALSCALPEPEHLVTRAFSFRWYWVWIWRRWCIIIIWIYRFRFWIRKYDGSPIAYQSVINTTAEWQKGIQAAVDAFRVLPAGQVTSEDAQQVVDYLTNEYSVEINTVVNEIISQQKAISTAGHGKIFGLQFKYIQGNQSILNNAVLANLPTDSKAATQKSVDKINSDLSSLVAAFPS